ncbi:MAG: hypothetical protein JNL81_07105 [Hyphomonadaceae bacterium]|nr:hypothetical protein [Hyphomonadaceae bacterium]
MTTSVRSIDTAAAGYVRHLFVRALSASFVVAAVFGILATTLSATIYSVGAGGLASAAVAPLGVVLVFLLFVMPVAIVVSIGGALIDLLHRRIVGLALFVLGLFLMVFLAMAAIYSALATAGVDMRSDNYREDLPFYDALWLGAFAIVACAISYQVMRAGWWQLTSRSADFCSARGWRPSPWRLLTSFRRYLGLPSFLSYVGKKRSVVTMLYFGVAVLNLGLFALLFLPVALGTSKEQVESFNPVVVCSVIGALLLLNIVGAGDLLARLADTRATKLYQSVREWDARPPVLFLRAFNQDSTKLYARGGDPFARWPAGVGRVRTLDEILLEHGSPYGPVIAIGDPRDPTPPLGAARVFVEGAGDQWQDVVTALAGASHAVVLSPNRGEGVQWELDLIAHAGGRLQTILLASPALGREETLALFERLAPGMPQIPARQVLIAAYAQDGVWTVLTTKRLSLEAYVAALNAALQSLFGLSGVPMRGHARG